MFQRQSTISDTLEGHTIQPIRHGRGDLRTQVKVLNLSKSSVRHNLGECAKVGYLGEVLAHDDSIFARNTLLTVTGVAVCSQPMSNLSKCGHLSKCCTQRISSGMMETGLWGDSPTDMLVESVENTAVSCLTDIDVNDEEWASNSKEKLSYAWSLEDECSDQMALVNPMVVESINSYEGKRIPCNDSDSTIEMNVQSDDDFNLFEFIFDDDRPLSDDQFQDLIDNPELIHTVEKDWLVSDENASSSLTQDPSSSETLIQTDASISLASPTWNASSEPSGTDDITPRRGRPPSGSSKAPAPVDDTEKYRRMRDLNNVASRRCRERRKRKLENAGQELETEAVKNEELKMKVRILQEQVDLIKAEILKAIVKA